jgi:hypothetical protein
VYFLAPEQFLNQPADERTDLYSLGCVLFYCLTAAFPFQGKTTREVVDAHLDGRYQPLLAHRAELPSGMAEFIYSLMARQPEQRPASAHAALKRFHQLSAQPAQAVSVPTPGLPARAATTNSITTRMQSMTRRLGLLQGRKALWMGTAAAVATMACLLMLLPGKNVDGSKGPAKPQSPVLAPGDHSRPPEKNLAGWYAADFGAKTSLGEYPAALEAPVDYWADRSISYGANPAHYIRTNSRPGEREKRLPKLRLNNSRHGLWGAHRVLAFDNNCLLLATNKQDWLGEGKLDLPDNETLWTAPELTVALLVRSGTRDGTLLGFSAAAKTYAWEFQIKKGRLILAGDNGTCIAQGEILPQDFCILFCTINAQSKNLGLHVMDRSGREGSAATCKYTPPEVFKELRVRIADSAYSQPNDPVGSSWLGELAEMLVYDTTLDEARRQAVGKYLQQKYFLPKQ